MKKIMFRFAVVFMFCVFVPVYGQEGNIIKLKISAGSRLIAVDLYDNPTTKDLVSLLPLTLDMRDYLQSLKYGYLPRSLSEEGGRRQTVYETGDVAYYPSNKEFILFYQNGARLRSDYIIIGKITSNLAVISALGGSAQMRIERE